MHTHTFIKHQSGAAIIEFALISPILILILLGVIEFGLFFYKDQTIQRAVNSAVNSIQSNPTDPNLRNTLVNSIRNVVNFDANGNILCADSYATEAAAKSGLCRNTSIFMTSKPAGINSTDPYYIVLVSSVKTNAISSLISKVLPQDIKSTTIFRVDQVSTTATSKTTIANCNGPNQLLQTDGSGNLVCGTLATSTPPNCTEPNKALHYNNGSYSCDTITLSSNSRKSIDPSSCRIARNTYWSGSPSFVSGASCNNNEIAISGGYEGEMAGSSAVCAGTSRSVVHLMKPQTGSAGVAGIQWVSDAAALTQGEACVVTFAVCCNVYDALVPQ